MPADVASTEEATLDVRDIDGRPFGPITDALADLDTGETLLLINSFEPEPLYDVLEDRGFEYAAREVGPEEYHVEITATEDSTDSRLLAVVSRIAGLLDRLPFR